MYIDYERMLESEKYYELVLVFLKIWQVAFIWEYMKFILWIILFQIELARDSMTT